MKTYPTVDGTFLVDLDPGVYDVRMTLGDTKRAHDQMVLAIQDEPRDVLATDPGEFLVKTYRAEVSATTGGQLAIHLEDTGGETAVDRFDSLVLRGSYSDGFSVGDLSWSPINLRDQWARDAQLAMGQPAPHGKYVQVYINGLYWGLYNATERVDESFGASYFGGDKGDYVLNTDDGLNAGDLDAWNQMQAIASGGLADSESYEEIQQLLDVDNLIDYMIVEIYTGNWDWPQNNWLALYERSDDGRFRFPVWDVEVGLGAARNASGHDLNRNRVDVRRSNSPVALYTALRANADFRLRFADHLHRYFFNDGPLTPSSAAAVFQTRVDEIYDAIVPETARWGDHNGHDGPMDNLPYTRDGEWNTEIDWILHTWFPRRTGIVLDQFRAVDLYPNVDAPTFNQHGGQIGPGFQLIMSGPGDIYYTLDGSDPRRSAGEGRPGVADGAIRYQGPIVLGEGAVVKAPATGAAVDVRKRFEPEPTAIRLVRKEMPLRERHVLARVPLVARVQPVACLPVPAQHMPRMSNPREPTRCPGQTAKPRRTCYTGQHARVPRSSSGGYLRCVAC